MKSELKDFRLDGKVAIVTGGNRGIGRACALALARAGAKVAIVGRDVAKLEETAKEISELGRRALPIRADITNLRDIGEMVKKVLSFFGQIDILVNNAGMVIQEMALDVTEKSWDATMNVNLKGLFFCSQKVASYMITQKRGKIINISSILGQVGLPEHAVYCASKGGVELLTKVLALEWGKYYINVNAVSPSFTRTEMATHVLENKAKLKSILNRTPLYRLGEPVDIAAAVVYLASPASDYVTGHVLLVDGGWTAQ